VTVTVASFRQNFPEFTDPSIYDANLITTFIALGVVFQNQCRWDAAVIDYGTGLYVAHNMVLQARADAAARVPGGIPGTVQGVQSSKSVDKVSVGYDTAAVTLEDGAYWNSTTYGIRFLQLSRAYGSGGAQIGTGLAGSGLGGFSGGYGGYGGGSWGW
jgi:hypothetical protein